MSITPVADLSDMSSGTKAEHVVHVSSSASSSSEDALVATAIHTITPYLQSATVGGVSGW